MSKQRMGYKPVNEFINFVEVGTSASGKTKVWNVVNIKNPDDTGIGFIRWHGPWRKYVYECGISFYDWECLRLIADFIEFETRKHYDAKRT